MDIDSLALKDRAACDAAARIPTSRWPFYGTTLLATIAAADTPGSAELVFEAERDVLFVDMSVRVFTVDVGGNDVEIDDANVSISYCNTDYMVETNVQNLRYCCSGKVPAIFGVRENKKLRITVNVTATVATDVQIEVSLNGFQGDGCCS